MNWLDRSARRMGAAQGYVRALPADAKRSPPFPGGNRAWLNVIALRPRDEGAKIAEDSEGREQERVPSR